MGVDFTSLCPIRQELMSNWDHAAVSSIVVSVSGLFRIHRQF